MPFISNTDKQRQEMLNEIGVKNFSELIKNIIPENLLHEQELNIHNGLSEIEIRKKIINLAKLNTSTEDYVSFLGGGVYDHFVPAAVNHIINRPEFYSAYTPYQAEVSQGTLMYIYEYQTIICELTGMEIANASMYDGATASAEALLMAIRQNKRETVLVSELVHPAYRQVTKTYLHPLGIDIKVIPSVNGKTDVDKLQEMMTEDVGAVLIQTPNFFGNIEEMHKIDDVVHSVRKAMLITAVDPISLMILNSPAEYNADIVIGEGQVLGNAQNLGGPLFGFFATREKFARKMPGRIVGATIDTDGNKGYVLTLQAREQHIRREKATSNICTNESLCVLAATVYISLLGKKGLREVAEQSAIKAHYLFDKITKINGIEPAFHNTPFFKEFVVKTPRYNRADEIISKMLKKGYFAGINLSKYGWSGNCLMLAVTEKRTKEEIDNFVNELKNI